MFDELEKAQSSRNIEKVSKIQAEIDNFVRNIYTEKMQQEMIHSGVDYSLQLGEILLLLDSGKTKGLSVDIKEKLLAHIESINVLLRKKNTDLNEALVISASSLSINEDLTKPAPQLLSEQEAKENPIKAAAQELVVEIYKWKEEDSNEMISIAKKVVENAMTLSDYYRTTNLASAARKETKARIIESSQNIYRLTIQLEGILNELLDKLQNDPRLKSNTQRAKEKMSTLSTQLKILAAVKATNPRDTDTHLQMNICAKNLTDSIKQVLNLSELVSLRVESKVKFIPKRQSKHVRK